MKRTFLLLWLSETFFDLGAALMGFALGVWVFEKTGSAEQFAWTVLASTLPALVMLPMAGALADRFDRRVVIASCDVAAAVMVAVMAVLLAFDRLQVHHLYFFNAVGAVIGALRNPAYKATVSQVVPLERLTQANGAIGLSQALLQSGAPLAAGYLMAHLGLGSVMLVQLVLALAGAAAVFAALSSVPRVLQGAEAGGRLSLLHCCRQSFGSAVHYFRGQPLMRALLVYVVLQESLLVLITSMITPLVLSTHSSEVLGLVMSVGAVGAMAGAGLTMLLRPRRHLMMWVLGTDALLSAAVAVAGFSQSPLVWCLCALVGMGAGSASGVCAGALWMQKAPTERQGSVFAFIDAMHLLAACVVVVAGGMLGERVLEPALMPGGVWADNVGAVVGVGQGRGHGLLFAFCGVVCLLASLLALARPRLRRLDSLVPDRDAPPAESTPARVASLGAAPEAGGLRQPDPSSRS